MSRYRERAPFGIQVDLVNRFLVHYTKRRAGLIHKIRKLTRVQAPMERTRLFAEIPNQTLLIVVERSRPGLRRNEGESRFSNSFGQKFRFNDSESNQGYQEIDDQDCSEDGPRPSALFGVPGRQHCEHRVCWKDVMRQLSLNQCEHEKHD